MWLKRLKDYKRGERLSLILTNIIRFILIIAIVGAILETAIAEAAWMTLFVSSLSLLLTFSPHLIRHRYRVKLPGEIQIIIVLFIYASLFLGIAREWYQRFWWWDSVMHALLGLALGFAGFLILYVLYKSEKLQAGAFLIVLFSFCFAVALGTLWEIFEFGIDSLAEENMQRARFSIERAGDEDELRYQLQCMTTGYIFENVEPDEVTRVAIYDTMWDIILNSVGALVASICGYLYLKKGEIFLFDRLMAKFEHVNPELFNHGPGNGDSGR